MTITRGTTPTITIKVPMSLADVVVLYVTFAQNKRTVLERDINGCEVVEDSIKVYLSQEETLKFAAGQGGEVQARYRLENNKSFVTKPIAFGVNGILKGGVI